MPSEIASLTLLLFVPGDRADRFAKAAAAGPDAVIVDLEDAVAPEAKRPARAALAEGLSTMPAGIPVLLRINAAGTQWHEADLAAAAHLPLAAVLLPKAENADDLRRVADRCGCPVIALVETAAGLHRAVEIAGASARLAFGSIDFAADLAMGHTRQSLLAARSALVMVARLAGQPAPIDGVTTAIHDAALIADDCAHSVELGFSGKLLIHPAQIAPARRGFAPTQAEIDWAARVLAATTDGAATRVDGAMVDAPVIRRAGQIMARRTAPAERSDACP
ncbi:HpcH/HpaI aldolase/citrate lyase family protein [Shinella sp.]|uniref:HpcH/HpaI aldolase/citrate lyase family protein n=1 Tax=Shinella sp. TaxID=1870904 RepID=UPI0039E63126